MHTGLLSGAILRSTMEIPCSRYSAKKAEKPAGSLYLPQVVTCQLDVLMFLGFSNIFVTRVAASAPKQL